MNTIEKGLSRIIGRAIRKNDAGRKDIGIHSLVEDTVKEAIEFLDSEGVVRKVNRELPESEHTVKGEHSHGYYECAQEDMLNAGYVAVERLVKE